MALVNIDVVLLELRRHLKKSVVGSGMELMSYKRNRTIAVIKATTASYRIIEKGYENIEYTCTPDQLEKRLKKLIKREFPP